MDDVLDTIDQTTETDLGTSTDDQLLDTTQIDSSAQNQDGQQTEEKVDGRRFNPEWSKALKEMRELYANDPEKGPKIADMLTKMRDNYARYQELQSVAPKGLEDVRAWKTQIDALGGAEAAAEMMQRVAGIEEIDAKIAAADFSVIGELPEEMQKGVYGMIPDMLSHLSQNDERTFSNIIAPYFQAALAATGISELLNEQWKATEDPAARGAIQALHTWYQKAMQGYSQSNGQKSVDPQVARLQAQLNERTQSDTKAFVDGLVDATNKYTGDWFAQNASVYIKQLNLTESQQKDLKDSFESKLADKLEKDTAFQKQLGAFGKLKNRDSNQVNDYIKSTIDSPTNAKALLDGLVTARYGGMRKAKPAAVAATTTDNGATRVAQPPPREQWDLDKMLALGHPETVGKGIFYLKGGRTVHWARPN